MVVTEAGHRISTLESGARVITAPMRERASVAVAFMFSVGSRFEDRLTAGLAHFIEHMVFKGGRRYPTAKAISEEVEGVGGVLNADTDRELTVFWTRVPGDRLAMAVDVLSDMLLAPALDPDEVARERLVVLEELRMTADTPQDHVQTLFDEALWGSHPLGWDIAGREETVRSFTRDQCLSHLRRHYRPARLVVSMAGAVDHDEAVALVERRVAGAPGADEDGAVSVAPPGPPGIALRAVSRPTEQTNIVVGGRAASLVDGDRFAVDVLNALLGDGMSSRLFLELRERRALAYDVHSFTARMRDTGALGMYVGCDPARADEALRGAVAELELLATEPVAETELRRGREYLKGRLALSLESTSAMCSYLGQQEALTGEILSAEQLMEKLDGVTAAAVMAAADRTLRGGLSAGVVGPVGDAATVQTVLEECGARWA